MRQGDAVAASMGRSSPRENRVRERGVPGMASGRPELETVWAEGAPGVFLGRDAELEALDLARRQAHAGSSRTVLVDGPPGVGKSALLRRFLSELEGVHVLDASGDELETATTYGVVEQLLRAGPFPSDDLPVVLDQTSLADPPTVGAELFSLLGAAAGDAPVVLVVDDLHWADTASLQALAFALRRLRTEPVLALLAVRRELLHRLPPGLMGLADSRRGVRLALGGLPPAELSELAWLLDHGQLSEVAVERLRRHTDGNPLHARALLEELSTDELEAGGEDAFLPAPRAFAALVLDRLADCPPEAEGLVAAAAVMGMSCPLRVAARLADVNDPLSALQTAVDANLLMARRGEGGYEVRFPHVLVRAAVYHHHLGPARAASLHRRAAALVDDEAASLRHRAAASEPDTTLADEAAAFARREAARGAWSSAAAALLQASRLSPARDDRERRLVDALEYLLLAGDGVGVRELTPRLEGVGDGARARYIRGRLALVAGDWPGARQLLEEAWATCDPPADPELAARIAGMAATIMVNLAEGAQAVRWGRRALELGRHETAVASDAPWALMFALGLCGGTDEGLALADRLLGDTQTLPAERVGALTGRGVLHLWRGDASAAIADLAAAYEASQRSGPFHIGHIALFYLADAEYRIGAWDEALAHADAAVSATVDADQAWFGPLVHAVAAFPLAARGEWEAATRHVQAAERAARAIGHLSGRVWAATAAARLASARDDHHRVLEILEPIAARVDELGLSEVRNPAIQPWGLIEAEARLRTGQHHGASDFGSLLDMDGPPRVLMQVNRLRGLLAATDGDGQKAEEAFRLGLGHAEDAVAPFCHALLELDYGTFLRREGRRRAAREQLEAAQERLHRLGARPYLARCEQELRACGGETGRRGPTTSGGRRLLTPQESAVAKLVGGGASNRQTAAALFVSVKAVEYHLSNIYRKLGIRSRTELAAQTAHEPPPVPPSEFP